jgi:hypothetical protein
MRRSSHALALACVVFVAAFWLVRSQSQVLRRAAQAEQLRPLAQSVDLDLADALAASMLAPSQREEELRPFLARFSRLRARFGGALAAVALDRGEALVEGWLQQEPDPERVLARRRTDKEAYAGVAFEQYRSLFAARLPGRDG